MKLIRVVSMSIAACVVLVACGTHAQQSSGSQRMQGPGGKGGPPEEAFTACENLAEDSACTVETPRGTLSGICRMTPRDERLVCMPER